jgi:dihydroneopterin aldolase
MDAPSKRDSKGHGEFQETLRLVIRDLNVTCRIGVTPGERRKPQRMQLNLSVEVVPPSSYDDDYAEIVDYGHIVERIKAIVADNDSILVETLADRIVTGCLSDPRVRAVKVRVEKLDRFAELGGLGIELERRRG